MTKKLLPLFLLLFLAGKAWGNILIATTSCNLSGNFCLGRYFQAADTYAADSYLTLGAAATYTPYFTPLASTDAILGCALYFNAPTTVTSSNTITLNLEYNGTIIATATAYHQRLYNSTYTIGGNGWWGFITNSTGTIFGNTDANKWRFRATDSSANHSRVRKNGTTMAYVGIELQTSTIASGDSLIITGNEKTAGTINQSTVIVDISTTLGSATWEAVQIGKGGVLDFGDAQTSNNILTCNNHFRVNSSLPSQFGLRMGTQGNPLTRAYTQKILFGSSGSTRYRLIGNDDGGQPSYTYDQPRISVWGASTTWRTTSISTVTSSSNSCTFAGDLALTAGTTVMFGASTAYGKAEKMVVSTYIASPASATFITNFVNTHSSGVYVWSMSQNAVIGSVSSVGMSGVEMWSVYTDTNTRGHYELGYVEFPYVYDVLVTGPDNTSIFTNLKLHSNTYASQKGLSTEWIAPSYCVQENYVTLYPNKIGNSFLYTDFVNTSNAAMDMSLASYNTFDYCYFDGIRLTQQGNSGLTVTNSKFASGAYAAFWMTSSFLNTLSNNTYGYMIPTVTNPFSISASQLCQVTHTNENYGTTVFSNDTNLATGYRGTLYKWQQYNNTINDHRLVKETGWITRSGAGLTDNVTKNVGEYSLRFAPFTLATNSPDTLYWDFDIAVPASAEVSVYGYVRKNSSYGSSNLPFVKLSASDSSINKTATMSTTTAADTWEYVSVSSPVSTSPCYVTIRMGTPVSPAPSGAVGYFGGFRLIIGDTTNGSATTYKLGSLWQNGEPTTEPFGPTVDGTYLQTYCQNAIDARLTAISTNTANANWNELKSAHSTSGSYGVILSTPSLLAAEIPAVSTTSVSEGVWKYQIGQSTPTTGSTGRYLYRLPSEINSDNRKK